MGVPDIQTHVTPSGSEVVCGHVEDLGEAHDVIGPGSRHASLPLPDRGRGDLGASATARLVSSAMRRAWMSRAGSKP